MHFVMVSTFFFAVLLVSTVSGEENQTNGSVWAGSTFNLPATKTCLHTKDTSYELKYGQKMIGWYEDGKLRPHDQFQGRLQFYNQNCTFALRHLTLMDTGIYTITARYMENEKPKIYAMTFNLTVLDHVTSAPSPTHMMTLQTASNLTDHVTSAPSPTHMMTFQRASNLTDCNKEFPAVCISLAPLMNLVINLVYLPRCWTRGVTEDIKKKLLLISEFVSLACQVVSIGLWTSCGLLGTSVCFGLAVGFTAITAITCAAHVISLLKCITADCFSESVKFAVRMTFVILQSCFTACAVIAFYLTHAEIITQKIWALVTFAVIYLVAFLLPCIVSMVYHSYCCPRRTEEAEATEMEKMNPPENGSSIKEPEKSLPLDV